MRRWVARLLLTLPLLMQGCLLDIAPSRKPIDDAWKAHMLDGRYGRWVDSERTSFVGSDEMRSSPGGASDTRYGISITEQSVLSGAGWWVIGGMVARLARPDASVELFGKEVARTHGMKGTVTRRDYSYEFFLVVRPTATGRGRLIAQWSFPNEELVLHQVENLPRGFPSFSVEGFLSFDEQSKTAIVTIRGLVRPFEERVNLTQELP